MKVEQIAVFLDNRPGRLAEVTQVLAEANINLRALSLADTEQWGILRFISNDQQKARLVLQEKQYRVSTNEVLAVEVDDRPGGLARILRIFAGADINVEYMYAFFERTEEAAVMIFRLDDDDLDKARRALQAENIRLLKGEEIYNM